MANKRLFYAVYQIGFAKIGESTFTEAHGVQSVGVTTRYNLEEIFEVGQLDTYEIVENVPDVEVSVEKVLDGYPLIYHLATNGATSATLAGRSNVKSIVGISYFTDTQDAASGVPLYQMSISGVFPSQLSYNFPVDGNCTEQVTLVGNNKIWLDTGFTFNGAFDNTDSPLALLPGSGGVQRREDVLFGSEASLLPQDIPGITSSGTNELVNDEYGASMQSIRVSTNLGRESLFELGRRGPYHRFVSFPTEVTSEFECYFKATGAGASADEFAENNVVNRTIKIMTRDGTVLDLGTKNKLESEVFGGGNAGGGGNNNVTVTYTYKNFNYLTVTQPQDPSGL